MLYRKDVGYRPFSDAQIAGFSKAADLEYAGDFCWRDDLDETARDFIVDHYNQQWDSPSQLIKQLKRIKRDPSILLDSIADEVDALPMPLSAALCHGTGWSLDQLANAAGNKDGFVAGVAKEIEFLARMVEKRKAMGATGNQGRPAVRHFVNRLAFEFQDAFLCGANSGLSVPLDGSPPTGPFLRFAKAVLEALMVNLSTAVLLTDPDLAKLIKGMCSDTSTSIFQHFSRSEYYQLVTGDGKLI